MTTSVWPTVLQAVQSLMLPFLGALGTGLAGMGLLWMNRWKKSQERKDALLELQTMKDNAKTAVNAVEQMYPDLPGEKKAALALTWANHLNMAAHISAPSLVTPTTVQGIVSNQAIPTILNEAQVLALPPTPAGIDTPKG
jgi:hypothetical protein